MALQMVALKANVVTKGHSNSIQVYVLCVKGQQRHGGNETGEDMSISEKVMRKLGDHLPVLPHQ